MKKKMHRGRHNIGIGILSSLQAIKQGKFIVVKQNDLKEGIKKLLK